MNKKAIYSILSTIVAMVVLSVSLVFAIGPKVSAARVEVVGEEHIVVLDDWDDFNIDENGVLRGLSSNAWSYLGNYGLESLSNGIGYRYAYEGEVGEITSVHVIIPEGVTEIGNYAFEDEGGYWNNDEFVNYSLFNYVQFPSTLQAIRYCAFSKCRYLSSIVIPDGVKIIEAMAFEKCTGISQIIIPESTELMEQNVFDGCSENLKIYCECSEEYANENWNENWNVTEIYDKEQGRLVEKINEVVWDCYKTISFEVNGGNEIVSQKVCVDSLVTEPTVPTKDGYKFKGWYSDEECTDAYDFETAVTDDVTLYAKWEEVQTQPEPTEPENSAEENTEVNNQNNNALIWGIAGTAAGILIIAGIVVGIVIVKRRRK